MIMVSRLTRHRPWYRRYLWPMLSIVAVVSATLGLWCWHHRGQVHPSHVPFGFPGDTVLMHGHETDLPGKAKELSSSDRSLYLRGVSLLGQGETARASDIFQDLITRQPHFGLSFYYQARILLHRGSHEDSVQADKLLSRGISGDPGQPWLLMQQAELRYVAAQFREARELLAKALDFAPDFREAIELLAQVEFKSENYERAQRLTALSISLAKGGVRARYDLMAEILFAREKDDSASKAIDRGLEQNAQQPRYLWLRGLIAESRGDTTTARQDYEKAISMRLPEAAEALRTLGLKPLHGLGRLGIHPGEGTGDPDYLLAVLLPLSRSYPQNAPLWYAIGRAYNTKGLYVQADESFQKALSLDSTVPELREWWGQNRLALEEKAHVFNAAHADKSFSSGPDNNWYDLGHYRIPWGTSRDAFLGQFPSRRFEEHGSNVLTEARSAWGIHYTHEVLFDVSGLWGVRVIMSNDGRSGVDLMEEGIRQNVLQAGSGSFLDPMMCPGLGQVDLVVWESPDSYEIMVKSIKYPKRIFLLRMKSDRVPSSGTCAAASMAAGTVAK